MDKVIVYGVGRSYKLMRRYIEKKFEVIGYCDKNKKAVEGIDIPLEEIPNYEFDFILVTSYKFFEEIKREIVKTIGGELEKVEDKIISIQDAFGDFRNHEIRDQWVIEHLEQIPKGKILLDAGAGQQRYRSYCSHLRYIAQDFGQYVPNEISVGLLQDVSWDYTGIDITCDIIDIPLDDGAVDAVLCTEVFEHLKNPILALKEFSRILKPGGTLLLTAPFCCLTHMAPYFYYNGFSEYWYKEHLSGNGFEIKELVSNGNFFKYMSQELFRVVNMAEQYCETELKSEEISTLIDSTKIMMRLSEKDKGSDETLCFGMMLMAEKI